VGSERGFVSVRLLVGLGLVVAVWVVPAEMCDTVTMGRTNATTPAECQGGWD